MQRRITLLAAFFAALAANAPALDIALKADRETVGMGQTVILDATVTGDDGKPLAGCQLLPYVNERRWGSHERTDAQGRARFWLPLPNPGPAEIKVRALPETVADASSWIWGPGEAKDAQTVYLQKRFAVEGTPAAATLHVAVDDACEIFLNGQPLGKTESFHKTTVYNGLEKNLRPGENVISVALYNHTGPGALLARLDWRTDTTTGVCRSDASWSGWTAPPANWPNAADGEPATVLGKVYDPVVWSTLLSGWPERTDQALLMTGRLLDEGAVVSAPLRLTVTRREIAPRAPSDTLFIMQWEPWFTPRNAYWHTAQAVPVFGFYDSYNRDVMRQHAIWFAEAGIDCILPDWSNHIWEKNHWSERPDSTNEIIHATTLMLETLADLKSEGVPVPKVVIMPGLSNGPPTTMTAMNEQLAWIWDNYVRNPRFEGLMQEFDVKPLVVILDCGVIAPKSFVPVDSRFTVRYMGTQLQVTNHEDFGYWSWMDGSLRPIVTFREGKAESITVTPGYFAQTGWKGPDARGRMGGTTYLESFKAALDARPRVVFLHQWNEYAGQSEGQGYGPNRDVYVDSYSVELSDDLEPVSLTAPAYRGSGGWGYYYHNLTRALMDVYRGATDTLLAVNTTPQGTVLHIEWSLIGPAPQGIRILIDGKVIAEGLNETAFDAPLDGLAEGQHTLTVEAPGATTRYALSKEREDDVATAQPVSVTVPFSVPKAN